MVCVTSTQAVQKMPLVAWMLGSWPRPKRPTLSKLGCRSSIRRTPISFSLAIPQSASCQMPRIKEICTVMDIPGITCPSNKSSLDARNEAREPGKRRRSRNLAFRRHRRSMSRRLLQEINGAGLEEIAMVRVPAGFMSGRSQTLLMPYRPTYGRVAYVG